MNEKTELDGKWAYMGTFVQGVFKIKIKGDAYVSFYNNSRYGKGTIIYDNDNFTLTSTHARWLFFRVPFVETVKGKYIKENEHVNVSEIEGRYSELNGIWARCKK